MKTREPEDIKFELHEAMHRRNWRKIEEIANADLRHKTDSTPIDYLTHWCNVARNFAYATKDYTWGEFEKEFAILIKQVCKYRVLAELLEEYQRIDPAQDAARWCFLWDEIASICEFENPMGLGATDDHPEGKIDPSDGGGIQFAMAADRENHKVVLDFGKSVRWIGMNPEDAVAIGQALIQKAKDAK